MVLEIDSTDKITIPRISIGFPVYKAEEIIKNLGLGFLIFLTDQPYCWTEKWQRLNSVVRVIKEGATQLFKDFKNQFKNEI